MSDVCHRISSMVSPLVDGGLDAASTIEVEEHVAGCANCKERLVFAQALKSSVKRTTQTQVPGEARARMLAAMQAAAKQAAEAQQVAIAAPRELAPIETAPLVVDTEEAAPSVRRISRSHRNVRAAGWALAVAASVAFFVVPKVQQRSKSHSPTLADIIAEHSRPLPPESNDPKAVRQFERYVGVPVKPMAFAKSRWVGGRVLPVQHERAAMMQYEVESGGQAQRVSMFIYDPTRIRVESADFEPRSVGTAEVRVGKANGYSVAVTERGGVGYLVASDLDADMSADMLMNASDLQ